MKALIIDTSLEISHIILLQDYEIIYFKKFENVNLSKELFTNLEKILHDTKTDISTLKYIAASIGPGSFTSLRVGATIAKTFSYAKNIPLISFTSMQAFRPHFDTKFIVAFDAKSEGIFIIEAEEINEKINYLSKPKLMNIEEATALIEKTKIVITPHIDILKEKFEIFKNKFQKRSFDPHLLIDVTNNLFSNKKFEDINNFKLLYLRGPKHS
ncbi:MAG: tRNA threonylcarbamoyladenosine biosynthesis protein TsaB [Candidatus Anoxychlamydiales bacterium]|nr:tRNA threonylcarbamoyladenosine biosynthesis protein TsaB [Candidatus Anoxychlamydiales bacterium]